MNDKSLDLTRGSLAKGILFFSIPLILSNLLQILFNMSDIAVIGRFGGAVSLGAVGSTVTLVTMFTTFVIGLGSGVNVIVAQAFGRKDMVGIRKGVQTALVLCMAIGVLTMVIAELTRGPILGILKTKDELIGGAELYLLIYFLGIPALAVYNFGSAVYSAAGNTRKPLIFLSISGVINIVLNLIFVIIFHLDVAGVALASAISQYISAICIVLALIKEHGPHQLVFTDFEIDLNIASKIMKIGIPSGLSNAIFQIANLFVQYGVNTFDAVIVEGNSAAMNADALDYDVMAAFYTAGSSFIGQNFGAGKFDRVKKTYVISIAYSFGVGLAIGLTLYAFGRPFLGIFTTEPAVIEAGMYRLSIMALSYGFSAFMDASIAASRGLGKSFVPTFIVIMGSCVFRIIWVMTIFSYFHTITALYLLYIFSWSITGAFEMAYFIQTYKKLKALTVG